MGKVIKIILSVLSALVLVSILLPVVLSLLLNLQSVQNYVGEKATGWLGRKMETRVHLDKLQLKLFNRVTLTGLYLEDYHRDTLFYARRISVPIRSFNLFNGEISLGEVELEGPKFYLMQDSTGLTNLKQILLKLKRQKPKEKNPAPFRLQAGGLLIRDMAFKHLKRERIDREGGVNFTDLDVEDFNLRVHHVAVINDSIHLDIDSLRLREKSGLVINNLSTGHFAISGSMMHFDRMSLRTPDSQVEMNYFRMEYGPKWQALKDFIQEVRLQGDIVDSKVSFRTIAYFAPSLSRWETVFEHLSGQVQGTVADMTGNLKRVKTRDTEISVAFGLHGIPDIPRTRFVFDVASLKTTQADIAFLLKDITGKELNPGTTRLIERLGRISFSGHFDGMLTDFKTDGLLSADPGQVEMRADIRPQPQRGTAFFGHVQTTRFDIGSWLGIDKLGRLSLHTDLNGSFGGNQLKVNTDADIPDIEFNGYTYRGIQLDGQIDNRKFVGDITSPDPNMAFDFNGQLDFNDSIPRYDFNLQLHNADLHKLGFNRRDTVSVLKTALTARASGTNLDDINGEATISNMTYINHLDTVRTGSIRLVAENSARRKLLSMHSSFADAEFRGRLSYNNMFSYFQNTLRSYLPSLSRPEEEQLSEALEESALLKTDPDEPSAVAESSGTTRLDDYYVLRLDVKEANNVAGIFVPGLMLAQGTKLSFLFNPQSDVFNLSLTSDFIERNNFFVSKLSLNSRNQGDSISLFLQSEDIFAGGIYMPNFSVVGGIKENNINIASRFNNPDNGMYAMLSTSSHLSTGPDGIPQLSIHFFPSTIVSGGQTWRVYAQEIRLDSTRVAVDGFSIDSGDQHLILDGVASRSSADTLRLSLNHFDLSTFSQLTGRLGYQITGYTNGRAEMVSALKDGLLSANIHFDSMRVNEVALPNTVFESSWDFQQQRARFSLLRQQQRDTLLYGYFRPTDGRLLANADLKGIDLSLLDPVLSGVILDTRGSARAELQLTNPDKKLRINGQIRLDSLATTVDFTRVPYTVAPARIEVKDNVMSLRGATVRDRDEHSGGLDLTFDFSHFANLKYDVRVTPENLQVLGTTIQDNNLFYGTVYASGSAHIQGSKNSVSMNINASTAGNSHFYMPLSSENAISKADFIVFREEGRARVADTVQMSRRKQLMLEQQRRSSRRAASSARMNIRMGLDVLPNTEVQLVIDPVSGDVLKGRGNGHLTLGVNPSNNEFTINGDYNITEGSMRFTLQNLLSRNFTLQSGSQIQFTGDPLDALLDVTAKYSLKASLAPLLASSFGTETQSTASTPVDCLIHMGGRLTDPNLTFDVQVPNATVETQSLVAYALNSQEAMATQFLWLLATKSFNSDNDPKIGTRNAAATGVDFLTNRLSSLLTTDRFSFVPKYTPGDDYYADEVGGSVYGELIKDRLIFEADMSYSTDSNKPGTKANTSLSGDATLSLLLDPAGNVRLRAFTRTIDRFGENQGLQETGLGITYRENFNNFKDLKQIFKDRFANIRRRREERRKARLQQSLPAPLPDSTAGQPSQAP